MNGNFGKCAMQCHDLLYTNQEQIIIFRVLQKMQQKIRKLCNRYQSSKKCIPIKIILL